MSSFRVFNTGQGAGRRQSHKPPITGVAGTPAVRLAALPNGTTASFPVQATQVAPSSVRLPHYPFQPLPRPNGPAPYRFDLSQLLPTNDVNDIKNGTLVFHAVGDTGDSRGRQQDFVSALMTQDAQNLPDNKKPAFFYHLGDVVYFAGDIDKYGNNFYETYTDYPAFIVAISGNHDCQPDDPQDGPVDPNKVPFDGWVQNFMSRNPAQLGSLKTNSSRTQLDLPNVFWTFTTPRATIIGLCSNVGETEGEFHQDQIDWFQGELKAANPHMPIIVTVHHPPFSGDQEHSGSSAVEKMLSQAFRVADRYPNLILSGHVHNYQRFTQTVQKKQLAYVVAGAGGYTNLGKLHKINNQDPPAPLSLGNDLILEQYDERNFGFLRLEIDDLQISGTYFSAQYSPSVIPPTVVQDGFVIDIKNYTVRTVAGAPKGGANQVNRNE